MILQSIKRYMLLEIILKMVNNIINTDKEFDEQNKLAQKIKEFQRITKPVNPNMIK